MKDHWSFRFPVALALPLTAFALTWVFWRYIDPYVFVLFYPAAFFAARLAGLYPGLLATAASAAGIVYLSQVLAGEHGAASHAPLAVFCAMGVLFSVTGEGARRSLAVIRTVLEKHAPDREHQPVPAGRDLVARVRELLDQGVRAQAALEEAHAQIVARERQLQAILDHVPAQVAYWDRDLRLGFGNRALWEWFGVDAEQTRGKHMREVLSEALLASLAPRIDAVLRGEAQQFVAQREAGGVNRSLQVSYVPDVVNGATVGFYVLASDITGLQRTSLELAETVALFTAFADNVPALVAYVDRGERYVYANRLYESWFGMPRSVITGRSIRELLGDASYAVSRPYVERVLRGERVQFERHLVVQGGEVDLDIDFLPRCAPAGEVLGFYIVANDVTERKRAQAAMNAQNKALEELVAERTASLQEREHELRTILDSIPAMIAHWDRDERNILANRAHLDWIGQLPEDIAGHQLSEMGEPYYGIRKPHIDRVLQGEVRQFEVDVPRPDGSGFRRGLVTYVPDVRDGEVKGFFSLVDDISELRRTQQALEGARDAAEGAARAKAEFLANMSHELRTPMNAVLGFAYLLGKLPLAADAQALVHKISVSGRILLKIINDILDFSRIEAGRLALEEVPFRLGAVLDDVSGIMSSAAADKHIELIVDASDASAEHLRGDSLRLGQILLNLVSNAVKFTERGHVRLRTSVLASSEAEVSLRFDVEDTGIGVAPDKLSQIFSAFSQAESSTSRRFGGTGLGLTITRRLVEMMGGRIEVLSTPGAGSTFSVVLPFQRAPNVGYSSPELVHQHVLIAEDHPVAREVLLDTARRLGWSAKAAASGMEVLTCANSELHASEPFDVLVLDFDMTPMDGLTAARLVRSGYAGTQMPIVMMVTASARPDVQALPGLTDIDALLTKPVTASSLYDAVLSAKRNRERSSVADARAEPGARLAGLRVLVVDDNEVNSEVAREILESEGAHVALANDGQQAIEWLRGHPDGIDVVLMDVQMPVMDGYQAVQCIRGELGMAQLPVYALTAGAYRADQEAALAAGMNGYFPKPFEVEQVVSTLQPIRDRTR